MPSPPPRYQNHYEGTPFPADPATDRHLAGGIIPDQDPNHLAIYETVITARLAYVGRVLQAGSTYMGLGPT
eukprot:4700946-Alexandrium_andersonii.AAC.1